MNEAGHSVEYFALLILIILSSSGCRITSKTERLSSGRVSHVWHQFSVIFKEITWSSEWNQMGNTM